MTYFDISDSVNRNLAQIETLDPQLLEKPINPDPVEGLQEVTQLLTFLPEDKREGAAVGFVIARLFD